MAKPSEGKSINGKLVAFDKLKLPKFDNEVLHIEEGSYLTPPSEKEIQKEIPCQFACCRKDTVPLDGEYFECFLNHPRLDSMQNPITILNIQQHQFADDELNMRRKQFPEKFPVKMIQNRPVICVKTADNQHKNLWKIALPRKLVGPVIRWYHLVLSIHVLWHGLIITG